MLRICLTLLAILGNTAYAQYDSLGRQQPTHSFQEEAPWQEQLDIEPPIFPKPESLREFYVSATTTNRYFIDQTTLTRGSDDIIRYTLVVVTSGGTKNISHEGIHCREKRWKLYAIGRSDSTWSKARDPQWRPIENKVVNRHHAELSRYYFCPDGVAIRDADEGRNALRLGKHPNAN